MNYLELKKNIEQLFEKKGVDAEPDIDWIICEVTGKKRSFLPFMSDINGEQVDKIMEIAEHRAEHIPLAYILGKTNFYGYDFTVNKDVLIPRIDTEILVYNVIKDIKSQNRNISILDIGTGSGIIPIVLAKETGCKCYAVDISKNALEIAKLNAKNNNVLVEFIESDLFSNIHDLKVDFIISNPPYIESSVINDLEKEVKNFEPILALDGGNDGLDFYKRIIYEAPKHLNKNGKLYFEIGYNQGNSVKQLMQNKFKNIKIIKDYGNNDRVVIGEIND